MAKKETNKKDVEVKSETKEKSLAQLRTELQRARLEIVTGKSKDTSVIKKLRKEIARKLTINKQ